MLAIPQFIEHPDYKIPAYDTPAEAITAHAGKGCYDSYGTDGRSIGEHISSLIESKHGSVLEHANFTLFITGISRGLSHEFVRHRAGFAYSQRSTRYTKEEGAAIVLSPHMADIYERWNSGDPITTNNERELIKSFIQSCEDSLNDYSACVMMLMGISENEIEQKALGFRHSDQNHRKWARGQARQLLPHALETRMTVTGNLRAWRHFFEQRSSRWAEDEIRRLSNAIYGALVPHVGMIMADYDSDSIRGYYEYVSENTKV